MQDAFTEQMHMLGQYCSFKTLRRALSRKEYAAATAELHSAAEKILAASKTGELAEDEPAALINLLFVVLHYDLFYGLMQRLDCDLIDTYAAREAMCADYGAWKATGTPGEGQWLRIARKNTDIPAIKAQLFAVLDALCMPVREFCEYPPEGTAEPKWVRKEIGEFELVTVTDAVITEDGGLFDDPHPNGKSYTLTDSDGCIYHLGGVRETTEAHADMQRAVLPGEGGRCFTAMGWIEGYTGRQRREIEFTLLPDRTAVFSFSTQGVNDEAADSDPRWQAYNDWADARMAFRRGYLAEFLDAHRSGAE